MPGSAAAVPSPKMAAGAGSSRREDGAAPGRRNALGWLRGTGWHRPPQRAPPSRGLPNPATERDLGSALLHHKETFPQPSSLSSPAPSPAKGAPLRLAAAPHFGVISPLLHEGPWGRVPCLSTPLLPKAAAAPFYLNNHNFHPPFHILPEAWTSKSIGSGRVPTLLLPLLLPTP